MEFVRSLPGLRKGCALVGPREQQNQNTAYIDGGQSETNTSANYRLTYNCCLFLVVYGILDEHVRFLREKFGRGLNRIIRITVMSFTGS